MNVNKFIKMVQEYKEVTIFGGAEDGGAEDGFVFTVSGTPDVDDVSGIILNNNGEQVFRLESHSIKNVETYNNHKEYIITTDTNRELSAWLA